MKDAIVEKVISIKKVTNKSETISLEKLNIDKSHLIYFENGNDLDRLLEIMNLKIARDFWQFNKIEGNMSFALCLYKLRYNKKYVCENMPRPYRAKNKPKKLYLLDFTMVLLFITMQAKSNKKPPGKGG